MKFTVSTLLALAIAAPAVAGTGFPVSIAIESSLNWGEMKVFGDVNDGDYVKLGELAQKIGDLHFMELAFTTTERKARSTRTSITT
jgi:hypothetical protein